MRFLLFWRLVATASALLAVGFLLLARSMCAQQPQAQSGQPLYPVNAKYVNGVAPGYWPTAGSGLVVNLSAGTADCGNPPTLVTYAGGTLTLIASATNYVYLDPSASCALRSNTTGFTWGQIPIATVVTGASSITTITDARNWFVPQPLGTDSSGRGVAKYLNVVRFADQFSSIQAAIDDLPASTGGIIFIPQGTYNITTINANKPRVTILCAATADVTIATTGTGPVFNITQPGVTIKNCSIARASGNTSTIDNLVTINGGEATLDGDVISGASTQEVKILGGTRPTIKWCIFNRTSATSAINVPAAGPTQIRIIGNEITGYPLGIDFEGGDGSLVEGNIISGAPGGTPEAVKYNFGYGHVFVGNWVEFNSPMFAIEIASSGVKVEAFGTRLGGTGVGIANYATFTGTGTAKQLMILDLASAAGVSNAPDFDVKGNFTVDTNNSVGFNGPSSTYKIFTDGTNLISATANINRWYITNFGHLLAWADNTYDLGTPSANRPRSIYLSGRIVPFLNNVTFSATPTFDALLGNTQTITLTGNVASSTLSNCSAGQWLVFDIIEDATGGRTWTWPTNVKGGGTVNTTASKHNVQMFYCDGTNAWAVSPIQSN